MSSYQNSSGNQPLSTKEVVKVGSHARNAEEMVDGYTMKKHKENVKKMAKKAKGK